MKRRLSWSKRARNDLHEIVDYIALDNPDAADAFADYVEKIADDLAISPIGRPGELLGTTERVLSRYPNYMLIFRADKSTVTVVRLFHSAQKSKH